MKEIETKSWEHFTDEMGKLRKEFADRGSPLLFRGHANSDWKLTTTLERAGCPEMPIRDYYRIMTTVGTQVGTFADIEVPEYSNVVEESLKDLELLSLRRFPQRDMYRFMVYLRHNGFPSPLLDWSRSLYVASFFAFRDAINASKVSVYAYCEMPSGLKGEFVGAPTIHPIGPNVRGHRRHARQQSDYTICARYQDGVWSFCEHDRVFGSSERSADALWKFNLPSDERENVLSSLDDYNLNAFSLFESEESLLETIWFRQRRSMMRAARRAAAKYGAQ